MMRVVAIMDRLPITRIDGGRRQSAVVVPVACSVSVRECRFVPSSSQRGGMGNGPTIARRGPLVTERHFVSTLGDRRRDLDGCDAGDIERVRWIGADEG